MKEPARRRISAESLAVIILAALAAPMAIPATRKLLGNKGLLSVAVKASCMASSKV